MIRNIPTEYTQDELIVEVSEAQEVDGKQKMWSVVSGQCSFSSQTFGSTVMIIVVIGRRSGDLLLGLEYHTASHGPF